MLKKVLLVILVLSGMIFGDLKALAVSGGEIVPPSEEVDLVKKPEIGPNYYDQRASLASPDNQNDLTRSPATLLPRIKSGAIEGWKKYKILPSISAAQAALESTWGESGLAIQGNNLFGIKGSYNGQSIKFPTQEYVNGKWITIMADFRKYPSWNESIEDHGKFLTENSRYANLVGITDYRTVAQLLQQDGYATDPQYANKLISIIQGNNLQTWDQEALNVTQKAVVISPFNEGEALGKLAEFRQKAPNYQAFLRRLPNETQYELVIQPFNVKEVDSKLAELNSKFPNWSKKVDDLRNVSQRKGVLITPFNGMEVAERYLEIKEKTGYSMQITGESSGQVNQTKKAVVISPFNEKEALERLKEFRAAFPSYQSFLMQLPNKTHYQLVVQPFTPAEANLKLNEMKAKFPNWSMKVDNLQDVINRKNILIAPFNGMEAWERYLEIKVKTGYSMQLVDV